MNKKKKNKERYIVFGESEDSHEFDIFVKNIGNKNSIFKYTICHSNSETWSEHIKGTKILTITLDDLDMKFKFHNNTKLNNYTPYCDIYPMNILLNFIDNNYMVNNENYKIIKY